MLKLNTNFESVFDTIETSQPVPLPFMWKQIAITDKEPILEIKLTEIVNNASEELLYKIYPSAISKYKNDLCFTLFITNARISKVNDVPKHLYGIRLNGFKGNVELYAQSQNEQSMLFDSFKFYCIRYHISNEYNLNKLIGKGNFSRVHLAKKLGTNEKYALKSIEKIKILENIRNMRSLIKEIEILRMLDHPNIIKLYEVYEDETHVHLVMEYLSGGELFQQITRVGMFSEIDAIIVMKNLLSALSYFHKFGIIHRDLKPENLIMADKDIHSLNKIADFGLATIMDKGNYETLKCGSPGYVGNMLISS